MCIFIYKCIFRFGQDILWSHPGNLVPPNLELEVFDNKLMWNRGCISSTLDLIKPAKFNQTSGFQKNKRFKPTTKSHHLKKKHHLEKKKQNQSKKKVDIKPKFWVAITYYSTGISRTTQFFCLGLLWSLYNWVGFSSPMYPSNGSIDLFSHSKCG